MPLIPAFEIGLWNAWIITVFGLLTGVLPDFLSRKKRAVNKMMVWLPYSRSERILAYSAYLFIMPVAGVYSIFLPLKLGTTWLYVGLPICFLAGVMNILAYASIAGSSPAEPVTRGVYRISRNPLYLSAFLMYLGTSIACASWVFLLFAVLWMLIWYIVLPGEERVLLEQHRDVYRQYMDRTPRWIGIPKPRSRT